MSALEVHRANLICRRQAGRFAQAQLFDFIGILFKSFQKNAVYIQFV
jgi:hypothetical protein